MSSIVLVHWCGIFIMDNKDQLIRVCTACGQKKPLSAFLQLQTDNANSTRYGTICAPCRSLAAKTTSQDKPIIDDRGSGSTGLRIGIKEKIQLEFDKNRQQKDRDVLTLEEKKQQQTKETKKTEHSQVKEKHEKDHRENYLKKKETTFLRFGTEKSRPAIGKEEALRSEETIQVSAQEVTKQTHVTEKEFKEKTIDLSAPLLNIQFASKYHGPLFQEFLKRLRGKSWFESGATPTSKLFEKFYSENKELLNNSRNEPKSEPLKEFVEKNWGPSSRKR